MKVKVCLPTYNAEDLDKEKAVKITNTNAANQFELSE